MKKCLDCNNTAKLNEPRCGRCQDDFDAAQKRDDDREDLQLIIQQLRGNDFAGNTNGAVEIIANALENIERRI